MNVTYPSASDILMNYVFWKKKEKAIQNPANTIHLDLGHDDNPS